MHTRAAVLALFFLLPGLATAQGDRDRATEVQQGAAVHAYLEYAGGATGSRAGSQDPYTLSETRSHETRWEAGLTLFPRSDGRLTGSLIGEWNVRASESRIWDYAVDSSSLHEETACEVDHKGPLALQVEGTPEPEGLRVGVKGWLMTGLAVPGACRWSRVETNLDGTTTDADTRPLEMQVALIHALEGDALDSDVSFIVPYDGRGSLQFSSSTAIPHAGDTAAAQYCGMSGSAYPWAAGTCTSSGTLTVRTFVDPCPYIRNSYQDHHANLANVAPPPAGADEAGVRAWAEPNAAKIHAVLNDQRSWQLFGCEGDLTPDPWDVIIRVMRLQRDALVELAKAGKLSREGISELFGSERGLQLMGVEDGGSSPSDLAGSQGPATASGTMQVKVHSPVSLHVWSEQGGHTGWDAATNASESTIPGATYEGAPGGAQTITLPAGFYKITVDELSTGQYLLDVTTNGTGADTEDVFLVKSSTDRTTSTHYALVAGWDGPRLDTFPVRRGATTDEVRFIDEGRPPSSYHAAGGPGALPGGTSAANDAPAMPITLFVVALGALAWARRRT